MSTSKPGHEHPSHDHSVASARFVSTKEAAKVVDYNPDYIGRLAREGKVVAEQRGRQWFVSLESLKLFSLQQAEEQRARQRELRERRLQEYAAKQQAASQRRLHVQHSTQALSAGLAAGVVATCFFLLGTLGWVVVREELQVAQLFSGADRVLKTLQAGFSAQPVQSAEAPTLTGSQVRIEDGALRVAEGAAFDEVFSDPVAVQSVGTSSAVVTPLFTNDGEGSTAYRVEVTPLNSATNL